MNSKKRMMATLLSILFLTSASTAYTSEQSNVNVITNQEINAQERPFVCYKCNKSFSRNDHLKRHIRAHSSDKFKCSVCDKAFSYKFNRNRHMAIHTGVKQYPCDYCGKPLTRNDIRKKHQENHCKKRPKKQVSTPPQTPLAAHLVSPTAQPKPDYSQVQLLLALQRSHTPSRHTSTSVPFGHQRGMVLILSCLYNAVPQQSHLPYLPSPHE